ncbi:RnfH family protein [Pigmentiphaga soli]
MPATAVDGGAGKAGQAQAGEDDAGTAPGGRAGQGEIEVTVCHAPTGQPWLRTVRLAAGATVARAIEASGFRQAFPDVDPERAGTGVYGHARPLDHVLSDHDRVEIYRPLVFDPMESRRRRAAHKAAKGRRPAARTPPAKR